MGVGTADPLEEPLECQVPAFQGSDPSYVTIFRVPTSLPPAQQVLDPPSPRKCPGPATGCVAWESLFISLSHSIHVDRAASFLALRKGLPRDGVVFVELFLPREEALCLQPWGRAVFPLVKEVQDPILESPPGISQSRDHWGLAEGPRPLRCL